MAVAQLDWPLAATAQQPQRTERTRTSNCSNIAADSRPHVHVAHERAAGQAVSAELAAAGDASKPQSTDAHIPAHHVSMP